ncbi:MAG TPA: AAA family ATPase [Pseudoneobacillus sp.]|nr:AAA family ATPase [Pseudoneobacillus sp.]
MKKNDFIILIGSDGSGKTTIAEELSKILGYPVEHHGPVKSHEAGYREYFNCIRTTDYSVIKDRFHEGEKIFAPIYRGYEAEYFPELEKELISKFNPLLVMIYAPFNVILQRLEERGEDFVKPEHFKYCYEKVQDIFNESTLPKMMVNTEYKSAYQNALSIAKAVYR